MAGVRWLAQGNTAMSTGWHIWELGHEASWGQRGEDGAGAKKRGAGEGECVGLGTWVHLERPAPLWDRKSSEQSSVLMKLSFPTESQVLAGAQC